LPIADERGVEILHGRHGAANLAQGAGDGFAAVFILGTLRGWPLADRLARADAFARALCQIRGAVPAMQDFYTPFIRDWQL
jgi:fructokinase